MSTKARKCDQLMVDYLESDGSTCTNEQMQGMAAGLFNSVKNNAVGEPVLEAMIKLNRAELLDYFLTKVPRTLPVEDKHIGFRIVKDMDEAGYMGSRVVVKSGQERERVRARSYA